MTENELKHAIEKFALRVGMTFATLIASRERPIAVATMLARFEPGATYAEYQVNERLQAWLDGVGAHVETDRVTLRRWLVDTGQLSRNAHCSDYRLAMNADDPLLVLARAIDAGAVAIAAREKQVGERAQRKAAWAERDVHL